jgi:hypothetical protein
VNIKVVSNSESRLCEPGQYSKLAVSSRKKAVALMLSSSDSLNNDEESRVNH